MEGFNEQVVHRAVKPKNIIIKVIAVMLEILIPTVCILLAYVITAYMIYVGFFLFLIGIYLVWYVFTSQKVDFEYSVAGGELEVAKVVSLRKRKRICNVRIGEIEILGKGEKVIDGMRFSKTYNAAADFDKEKDNYYAVFNSVAYGRCLLVFNPNENTLKAMKPHLKREIVVELFYGKKQY